MLGNASTDIGSSAASIEKRDEAAGAWPAKLGQNFSPEPVSRYQAP